MHLVCINRDILYYVTGFVVQNISVINNYLPFIYTCRYSLMLSCWLESPIDRPVFSDVAASINTLIEPLAGYLDFADIKDNSDTDIEKGK